MTEEEKQAYFEKQRKDAEDRCRIRTREQFEEECKKAGIPENWCGYTHDRTRPVSMDEKTVYYRKIGKTLVSYPFQRWDVAFEELLKYRDQYNAFVVSCVRLQIDDVYWRSDADIIGSGGDFPYVTVRHVDFAEAPDQNLINEGWIFDGYDHYMGYCRYHRAVNVESLNGMIVVEFTKLTDERDKKEFGFTEVFMKGSCRYPVPEDLKEQIYRCVCKGRSLSALPRRELIRRFESTLIEDEFSALVRLKRDHLNALTNALDKGLSEKEQKIAFAEAGRNAEADNPAADNIFGSRSIYVINKNFDIVYEKAGLVRSQ